MEIQIFMNQLWHIDCKETFPWLGGQKKNQLDLQPFSKNCDISFWQICKKTMGLKTEKAFLVC